MSERRRANARELKLWNEGVGDTKYNKVSARMNFIGLQGEKHFRC